jgi:hypothetical protein
MNDEVPANVIEGTPAHTKMAGILERHRRRQRDDDVKGEVGVYVDLDIDVVSKSIQNLPYFI